MISEKHGEGSALLEGISIFHKILSYENYEKFSIDDFRIKKFSTRFFASNG